MNFFVGNIESITDPLKNGRVKCRVLGDHTSNTEILPTDDLPWATPLNDIHSHSSAGKGQTPLGLRVGSWVVGFYLDAKKQRPMILGSLAGNPGENDVNRLAVNDPDLEHISLTERKAARTLEVAQPDRQSRKVKVFGQTVGEVGSENNDPWSEPDAAYGAIYPDNHVYESTNGHIMEFDDTIDETDPDKPISKERIHLRHRIGTSTEMLPDGDKIDITKKDAYSIIEGSHYCNIKDNETITINGSLKVLINTDKGSNDYTIQIDDGGNCNIQVDNGQINLVTGGSGNDINIVSSGDINMSAQQDLNVKVLGDLSEDVEGKQTTQVTGNIDIDGSRIDLN